MCEKTIQNGSAKLIIVAKDASDNTKKNFLDASKYYHVPISFFGTKESLGKAIGKEYRASLVVIDANLSKKLKQYIEAEEV